MKLVKYDPKYYEEFFDMMLAQMAYHRKVAKPDVFKGYNKEIVEEYCEIIIERSKEDESDLLMALNDMDKVCGFVTWYRKSFDEKTDEFIFKAAVVDEMYVKESMRGKGIATQMMNILEENLKEQGYEMIILSDVHENNAPASQLYTKLGYEVRAKEYAKLI